MDGCVMDAYLCYFQPQKREINDKGGKVSVSGVM